MIKLEEGKTYWTRDRKHVVEIYAEHKAFWGAIKGVLYSWDPAGNKQVDGELDPLDLVEEFPRCVDANTSVNVNGVNDPEWVWAKLKPVCLCFGPPSKQCPEHGD